MTSTSSGRLLAKKYSFAGKLNSQARQSSAERVWSAISRFYDGAHKLPRKPRKTAPHNCKKQTQGKKGYPKYKKNTRLVEYQKSGRKLDLATRKHITFKDCNNIGRLKLVGTQDLHFYSPDEISLVRLIRRADGYYCQFLVNAERKENVEPTGKTIGLDLGLESFYTDSNGDQEDNPRYLRASENKVKTCQRRLSRKAKGYANRKKARQQLEKAHLRISRQGLEHAKKLARCVVQSNDLVAYEDLRVSNMVKNYNLSNSISDAGWYQFLVWLEYFANVFGKATVAVPPQYTSQECSNCGAVVKKSLSNRTDQCKCGCVMDRDENAAINSYVR